MSLGEVIVRIIGIVLAIVGIALILNLVGINFLGVSLTPWYVELIGGILCLGTGIWIIRGGSVSV